MHAVIMEWGEWVIDTGTSNTLILADRESKIEQEKTLSAFYNNKTLNQTGLTKIWSTCPVWGRRPKSWQNPKDNAATSN